MTTVTVKPAPGLLIRDPVLRDFIEPEGREVQLSPYWTKLLRDRDVEEVDKAAQADEPQD